MYGDDLCGSIANKVVPLLASLMIVSQQTGARNRRRHLSTEVFPGYSRFAVFAFVSRKPTSTFHSLLSNRPTTPNNFNLLNDFASHRLDTLHRLAPPALTISDNDHHLTIAAHHPAPSTSQ